MNKKDLIVGLTYTVRRNGASIPVSLLEIYGINSNGRTLTRYRCKNLNTDREITIKSPSRFLKRAVSDSCAFKD